MIYCRVMSQYIAEGNVIAISMDGQYLFRSTVCGDIKRIAFSRAQLAKLMSVYPEGRNTCEQSSQGRALAVFCGAKDMFDTSLVSFFVRKIQQLNETEYKEVRIQVYPDVSSRVPGVVLHNIENDDGKAWACSTLVEALKSVGQSVSFFERVYFLVIQDCINIVREPAFEEHVVLIHEFHQSELWGVHSRGVQVQEELLSSAFLHRSCEGVTCVNSYGGVLAEKFGVRRSGWQSAVCFDGADYYCRHDFIMEAVRRYFNCRVGCDIEEVFLI